MKQLSEKIYQMRSATDALRTAVGDERVSLASRRRGLEAAIADRDRLSTQAENTERLLAESEGQLIKCQSELSENAVLLERDIAALSERIRAAQAEAYESIWQVWEDNTQFHLALAALALSCRGRVKA